MSIDAFLSITYIFTNTDAGRETKVPEKNPYKIAMTTTPGKSWAPISIRVRVPVTIVQGTSILSEPILSLGNCQLG